MAGPLTSLTRPALHAENAVFRDFTHQPLFQACRIHDFGWKSRIMQSAVRDLGYRVPVVAQSMYIFKQPGIGGGTHCC